MRGWRRSGTVACPAGRALRAILMQDRRRTGAARPLSGGMVRNCGPLAARPDRSGARCDFWGTHAASGAFFGRAMRTGSPVSGMGGGSCVSAHRRPSVQADRMGARAVHGRFADVRSVSDSECAERCGRYAGASGEPGGRRPGVGRRRVRSGPSSCAAAGPHAGRAVPHVVPKTGCVAAGKPPPKGVSRRFRHGSDRAAMLYY